MIIKIYSMWHLSMGMVKRYKDLVGFLMVNGYLMVLAHVESVDHLLLNCKVARGIWICSRAI